MTIKSHEYNRTHVAHCRRRRWQTTRQIKRVANTRILCVRPQASLNMYNATTKYWIHSTKFGVCIFRMYYTRAHKGVRYAAFVTGVLFADATHWLRRSMVNCTRLLMNNTLFRTRFIYGWNNSKCALLSVRKSLKITSTP